MAEGGAKAKFFRETFFLRPATADLEDTHSARYTGQIELSPATEKEVIEAMRSTQSMKAPGPDGIPNKPLQASADLLASHPMRVVNQSLELGHCP